MNLSRRVERYLNLIDYRVQAKIRQDEREVQMIDRVLDEIKKKLTEQDTEDLLLYLKEQAENANAKTPNGPGHD